MEPIFSADQRNKPQVGDFTPAGVLEETGELTDIRNPLETQAQNFVQPAIITSQAVRRKAAEDTTKLRVFREELNRAEQIPRRPEEITPSEEGFSADEVNKVFGGDLSGFTVDRRTNRFIPTIPLDGEKTFELERTRKIARDAEEVFETLNQLKARATPTTVNMLNVLQRNYLKRAKNLRNF